MEKPNILYIMTDQQRFDTIASLGNKHIYTPNLDRLVKRGVSFSQAYSTCPVCVPARYTIRSGCEPVTTGVFSNHPDQRVFTEPDAVRGRTGSYLPEIMKDYGYRTFGIGKFHTYPWDEDLCYDVQLHSEELYDTPDQRKQDSYAKWIREHHPEYDFTEMLMGERTEMYYMPQTSPQPAECTVESWVAEQAVQQITEESAKPFFGLISFIGPHPPFAPPIPYNRLYDPDLMPSALQGNIDIDHMDDQIPCKNYAVWADDISTSRVKVLKSRYYGEITYIDNCIGKILDAVESLPNPDNVVIAFFSDHGDCFGDHHAWQKENFFEASCHIPFLLSWPEKLSQNEKCDELVCLTDLFGIAARAGQGLSGEKCTTRDGIDLLAALRGNSSHREYLYGYYGTPGTHNFKIMVRHGEWKYIYLASGGREQLFHMKEDPEELKNRITLDKDIAVALKKQAEKACSVPGAEKALENGKLCSFPLRVRKLERMYQFDRSRGVTGFSKNPAQEISR
jgi:arylsulfatase A-like enzyme